MPVVRPWLLLRKLQKLQDRILIVSMVTVEYHHALQCLTFTGYWGNVRPVKIGKLQLQY